MPSPWREGARLQPLMPLEMSPKSGQSWGGPCRAGRQSPWGQTLGAAGALRCPGWSVHTFTCREVSLLVQEGSHPTATEELASVSEGVFRDCEGSFLGPEASARPPPTSLGALAESWHSVSWASAEPFFLVPGKEEEAVPGRESGCQPDIVYLHSTQPDTSQLFTALDLVLARLAGTWPHCPFVPSQPGAQQGACSSGSPCSWEVMAGAPS